MPNQHNADTSKKRNLCIYQTLQQYEPKRLYLQNDILLFNKSSIHCVYEAFSLSKFILDKFDKT
jgi:hypothetical protein